MALHGEFEDQLDAAVFADTGWEPKAVYEHLWWLAGKCAEAKLPLIITSAGNLRDDAMQQDKRFASMPVFLSDTGAGREGRGRRQCTREYKIEPIGKAIRRQLLGLAPGRAPKPGTIVEQWFGISKDESQRMSDPKVRYMRHRYPLVDLEMTRRDCLGWLRAHGYERPPKSSCIGCPFHGDRFWRDLPAEEFADAADFDAALRDGRASTSKNFHGGAFLHRSLLPLIDVDLRSPEQRGQGALFDGQDYDGECDSGYCFV